MRVLKPYGPQRHRRKQANVKITMTVPQWRNKEAIIGSSPDMTVFYRKPTIWSRTQRHSRADQRWNGLTKLTNTNVFVISSTTRRRRKTSPIKLNLPDDARLYETKTPNARVSGSMSQMSRDKGYHQRGCDSGHPNRSQPRRFLQ